MRENIGEEREGRRMEKKVKELLRDICEDICDHYCRYRDTGDEEALCDIVRGGEKCPLDRLA